MAVSHSFYGVIHQLKSDFVSSREFVLCQFVDRHYTDWKMISRRKRRKERRTFLNQSFPSRSRPAICSWIPRPLQALKPVAKETNLRRKINAWLKSSQLKRAITVTRVKLFQIKTRNVGKLWLLSETAKEPLTPAVRYMQRSKRRRYRPSEQGPLVGLESWGWGWYLCVCGGGVQMAGVDSELP